MTTPTDLTKEDLLAIRKKSEEGKTLEWIEKYGDESWKAALTVMGYPADYA
jgi:hypothetical protein